MNSIKHLLWAIIFGISIISCNKEPEKQAVQPINQSADTNRWATVWQDESLTLISVSFISKDTGYVVAFHDSTMTQSIVETFDGGKTWTKIISNLPIDSVVYTNFYAAHNNVLYFQNNRTIYKSADGGKNWTIMRSIRYYDDYFYLINNTNLLTIDGTNVLISFNEGKTWDTVFHQQGLNMYNIFFPSGKVGYFTWGNNNSTIYLQKTTDGGHSWSTIKTNFLKAGFGLQFINDSVGFYVDAITVTTNLMVFKIYLTIDGGNNWQLKNTTKILPYYLHFIGIDTAYYFDPHNIYMSVNGCKSWKTDYTNKGQRAFISFKGWAFVETGEAYAINDGGRIIKKMY